MLWAGSALENMKVERETNQQHKTQMIHSQYTAEQLCVQLKEEN